MSVDAAGKSACATRVLRNLNIKKGYMEKRIAMPARLPGWRK
jgi:hypothetical protein